MKKYRIYTLKGKVITTASTTEQAIKHVCDFLRAPLSIVKKIETVKTYF